MEDTITLTEAELSAKVEEAVANATKELEAKHNKSMYELRQENKKLKDATKDQETLKKEQDEEVVRELNELRAYKKQSMISERLAKEGLPSFLKNDSRLINASDDDFEKVIKEVKKDYDAIAPKGSQHSTVVQTSSTKPELSDKDKANAEFGQALKKLVGR